MDDSKKNAATTYKEAGVDLEAADEVVERLGRLVEQTHIPGVLTGIGGFGGLFGLREAGALEGGEADPVLVSGTDGVGTKLKLAFDLDQHDTIGVDCVAMCVNDVITTGARPLFFLDYFATGRLRPEQAEAVVRGVARGCKDSGCALIGGETAEMPGFYAEGEYDIAGFCVGVVERSRMLTPDRVTDGASVVGVASSGVHSNGFSLVRKIIADANLDLRASYDALRTDRTLGEVLLEPTRLYARLVGALCEADLAQTLAHITGGGLVENLPRALASGLGARLDADSWEVPAIFGFLGDHGGVRRDEMFRVFNMGIGLAVVTESPEAVLAACADAGFDAWTIGEVVSGEGVHIG